MKPTTIWVPSKLLGGKAERLRELSLTRWMSRDLTQAAVDFSRNLGLLPVYCECSPEQRTRYLFWRLPEEAQIEVRSGRTKEAFAEFDRVNREKQWRLLSLHIHEGDIYSAVWISPDHFATAKAFLAAHGIQPAGRRSA